MIDNIGKSTMSRVRRLLGKNKPEPGRPEAGQEPVELADDFSGEVLGSLVHKEIDGTPRRRSVANRAEPRGAKNGKKATPPPVDEPEMGEILALENGEVVLYREPVPDQRYDFVYTLSNRGALKAQALIVQHYHPRSLGKLDLNVFRELIREKRWDRDLLVYHMAHWSFGRYLPSANGSNGADGPVGSNGGNGKKPAPTAKPARETPRPAPSRRETSPLAELVKEARERETDEGGGPDSGVYELPNMSGFDMSAKPSPGLRPTREAPRPAPRRPAPTTKTAVARTAPNHVDRSRLERGALVVIHNGTRSWEAVYWNTGANGDMLVHKLGDMWRSLYVDLGRFGDKVEIGEVLPPEKIEEIKKDVFVR